MVGVVAVVGPNNFLVRSNFEYLYGIFLSLSVTGDNRVAVRQSLDAAGIFNDPADVFIIQFPNDITLGIKFDHSISVGATN